MEFKDYFSKAAEDYARFRPVYPEELFSYLASLTERQELAWDCATGSGQAARGLVTFFERVIASDASASQIGIAAAHPRICYRVMPAEDTDLEDDSVDLITVGQALHWFDCEAFYKEADRTLCPGGVLAVWAYGLIHPDERIHQLLIHYYKNILHEFWPPEREKIDHGYQTMHLPYEELKTPDFSMVAHWSKEQLIGYLGTWSASLCYIEQVGRDPVDLIWDELSEAWGGVETREMTWPIHLRVGKKPK